MGNMDKLIISLCVLIVSVQGSMSSYSYGAGQFGAASEEELNTTWPTKMTFQETKTNYMLGTAILKRLYARMEHTETLFKAEMNQMYDKLRDQIRKCDRQRRRADGTNKSQNGTNSQKSGNNYNAGGNDKKQSNKKDNKHDKKGQEGKKQRDKQQQGTKGQQKENKKPVNEGYYSPEGYKY